MSSARTQPLAVPRDVLPMELELGPTARATFVEHLVHDKFQPNATLVAAIDRHKRRRKPNGPPAGAAMPPPPKLETLSLQESLAHPSMFLSARPCLVAANKLNLAPERLKLRQEFEFCRFQWTIESVAHTGGWVVAHTTKGMFKRVCFLVEPQGSAMQ